VGFCRSTHAPNVIHPKKTAAPPEPKTSGIEIGTLVMFLSVLLDSDMVHLKISGRALIQYKFGTNHYFVQAAKIKKKIAIFTKIQGL
jgi:hypothetical protein